MVELAADGLLLPGRVSVSDMELSRPGKSYTADTLEQLRAQNPGAELWLMMGTDMFLTLQNWREPERITALAGICAFARTQADCGELLTIQAEHLRKTFGAKVCVLQLPQVVDMSSTRLRELLARGGGWGVSAPGGVRVHPAPRALRGGAGFEAPARPGAAGLLLLHDPRQAHRPREGHGGGGGAAGPALGLMRSTPAGRRSSTTAPSIWNWTSSCNYARNMVSYWTNWSSRPSSSSTPRRARVARHVYGVSDDIYEAIFWHTTGKADMTLLEKLLYIADYMEPTRDFPGVERLRALAYEDLDAAVLLGCEMSIQEMAEQGPARAPQYGKGPGLAAEQDERN